jgi:hypothetical protein
MPSLARHRLIRTGLVVLCSGAAVGVLAPQALAGGAGWTTTSCSQTQSQCSVGAGMPGSSTSGGGTDTGTGGSNATASSGSGNASSSPVTCTDITPTATQLVAFGSPKPPSGKGHWVIARCAVAGLPGGGVTVTLRWQADGKPALPDPAVLAAQAESKLTLVKPLVDSSPAPGKAQVVQLPTWAWMPKAQWAPVSATASVPGESVTATASPDRLSFSWGDGTSSTCQGPGTPYVAGSSDPSAASPTCGHTYRITSASATDQQFPVTATLSWKITWAGGGQSGTFPDLATATTVHWTVEQVESVLVGGGSGA